MDGIEIENTRKLVTVRGLSGLKNLGNTCYMNAGLQCLFATGMLTSWLMSKRFINQLKYNVVNRLAEEERKSKKLGNVDIEVDKSAVIHGIKNTVTYAYYKTLKAWLSENNRIEPKLFKQIIGKHNSLFKGNSQNDSQELVNCILDNIHEDLKCEVQVNYIDISESILVFRNTIKQYQKLIKDQNTTGDTRTNLLKNYREYIDEHMYEYTTNAALEYWDKFIRLQHSIIRDIFTGMTYTETKCNECKITSLSFEPFIMLPIAIPKSHTSVNLNECLQAYTAKCMLVDKNKYQCLHCKDYRDATQSTYIWEVPEILIIQLKRFSNEMYGNYCRMEKNSTIINFPLYDLDLSNYISPYNNKKKYIYELYGVVQQHGTLYGGHYTACCKNSINDNWYQFDDSHVVYIEPEKVRETILPSAYILFYKKSYDPVTK
jgi:ubiquitin carboxyl-terminal hydrolase 8